MSAPAARRRRPPSRDAGNASADISALAGHDATPVGFMTTTLSPPYYPYHNAAASHTQAYLWPLVMREVEAAARERGDRRVFDLGCGNGAFAAMLRTNGYNVTGVDPSRDGIREALTAHPDLNLHHGSSEDDLASAYGRFPIVTSLEVVEHVYAPREFVARIHDLLLPGGTAIISTPYHGYVKNLALALTGKLDAHFTALWDHGHIKFWSKKTLSILLREAGFSSPRFVLAGRIPPLAKSMIAVAKRQVG